MLQSTESAISVCWLSISPLTAKSHSPLTARSHSPLTGKRLGAIPPLLQRHSPLLQRAIPPLLQRHSPLLQRAILPLLQRAILHRAIPSDYTKLRSLTLFWHDFKVSGVLGS